MKMADCPFIVTPQWIHDLWFTKGRRDAEKRQCPRPPSSSLDGAIPRLGYLEGFHSYRREHIVHPHSREPPKITPER